MTVLREFLTLLMILCEAPPLSEDGIDRCLKLGLACAETIDLGRTDYVVGRYPSIEHCKRTSETTAECLSCEIGPTPSTKVGWGKP